MITKDFISTRNLSREDIDSILSEAEAYREINRREIKKVPTLRGRTIVNLFYEASTRTRTSFETAGKRLGADVINVTSSSSSVTKGETLSDTVRNIEAMAADVVVIRHNASGAVKFIADNVRASIVNAGDGLNEHPTQAMLDLLTIKTEKGKLDGLTVTIIGDISHSRVARSDMWAMKTCGMRVKLFAPPTMIPIAVDNAFDAEVCKNMEEAVCDADVIIMLRIQRERMSKLLIPSEREYTNYFGLTPRVMEKTLKNPIVMHPGPINRGVELSSVVADSESSRILKQVENGVAVRMAVLARLGMQKSN